MMLPKYNVRFNVYQPTDRDTKFYYGYIYDPRTRKQKKWNTHEAIKAEALKRVREKIDEIYGNDETIETVQTDRIKTVEQVLKKYLKRK